MQPITLAIPYHDPAGELTAQLSRLLPRMGELFDGVAVDASTEANQQALALLRGAGAHIEQTRRAFVDDVPQIGQIRRAVVAAALRMGASWVFYCDGDRLLHWLEHYPAELEAALRRIPEHDLTVFGRTERAFASHPHTQRVTEQIINDVYAAISGHDWDVTAAARGLSRRAAEAIVARCHEDSFGVDAVWPLFLQQAGGFTLAEVKTEGLEFETATQYRQEVAAAGSDEAWKRLLDGDSRRWAFRLNLARIEVTAMIPYQKPVTESR
jgi:hypothetical protein